MEALSAHGHVRQICDSLAQQLTELARVRLRAQGARGDAAGDRSGTDPGLAAQHRGDRFVHCLSDTAIFRAVAECLGDCSIEEYGRWVYFSWSGLLVRLLPPDEFHELRTSRNRYKITAAEQERLRRLTVGIVGLSVGSAAAVTMALEGVGGHLKLADFDRLDLSNMNRLRAGVHELGLPKAVLTARHIMEINPYLQITLYEDGISRSNVREFLGGDAPVHVVVEECDSLEIKVLVREEARALGVPVVMETSDRGALDVERFDKEPGRAIFHGSLGGLGSTDVAAMDRAGQLAVAGRVVGARTVSTRLAASLVELGETLDTWPQLASEVMLGGATATAAVRRIGLGMSMSSGRRYIDMDRILSEPEVDASPEVRGETLAKHRDSAALGCSERMRYLVEHATLAPSGGNGQPWRFVDRGGCLLVVADRCDDLLDVGGRATYLSLGAVVENIHIAAASLGMATTTEMFPQMPCASGEVASASTFVEDDSAEVAELAALLPALKERHTNRNPGTGEPLSAATLGALTAAAQCRGAEVELVFGPHLCEVAGIIGEAERVRLLCAPLHRDMCRELCWDAREATARQRGIDVATLELDSAELMGLELLARPEVAAFLRDMDGGTALRRGASARRMLTASAAGLVTVAGDSRADWLRAGRALQRVWLEATRQGLAFQPMGALVFMLRLAAIPGQIYRVAEAEVLRHLAARMNKVFAASRGRVPVMLFRLAKAPCARVRSLRRPIEEIVSTEPSV